MTDAEKIKAMVDETEYQAEQHRRREKKAADDARRSGAIADYLEILATSLRRIAEEPSDG